MKFEILAKNLQITKSEEVKDKNGTPYFRVTFSTPEFFTNELGNLVVNLNPEVINDRVALYDTLAMYNDQDLMMEYGSVSEFLQSVPFDEEIYAKYLSNSPAVKAAKLVTEKNMVIEVANSYMIKVPVEEYTITNTRPDGLKSETTVYNQKLVVTASSETELEKAILQELKRKNRIYCEENFGMMNDYNIVNPEFEATAEMPVKVESESLEIKL